MRLSELWTHARAVRFGLLAALGASILWPIHAVMGAPIRPAFVAALMLTAFCGASILLMSVADLLTVARDPRILPARIFDVALGLALTLPPALALSTLLA